MNQWQWLTKPQTPYNWGFMLRVIVKGLILFGLINVAFALVNPIPLLAQITGYNHLWAGRLRLPFGENPSESYNLHLNELPVLFNAHQISGIPKAADEYRVIMIGDSSIWGVLLKPEETLAANLNAMNFRTDGGKRMVVYNLGFPNLSVMQDLLILDYAMRYQPDLIIWSTTAESMSTDKHFDLPLLQKNGDTISNLIRTYHLKLNPDDERLKPESFIKRTLLEKRRALADMVRLQLYGVMWASTGLDQVYPSFYKPRQENFDTDVSWHGLQPPTLTTDNVMFDAVQAGMKIAGSTPVLLVNEPIFISQGENSDLRYNFFDPRWSYDAYRKLLHEQAQANNWQLIDEWNLVAGDQFTDSAVHMTPAGTHQFAERIGQAIILIANGKSVSSEINVP